MDDKTEELRDIFMDVAEEGTVTESQEETPGSLTDERPGMEAVVAAVGEMRERYDFRTDLSDDDLAAVVEAFHDGADDAALAAALDVGEATAFRARMDLHLLTEADLDPEFDGEAARESLDDGGDPGAVAEELAANSETVAEELDADPEAVVRFAAAVAARNEALRANYRFRARFEEALGDVDLSRRLATDVREDGLDDATEGMETNTSF
jgi:hypothetical protein